MGYGDRLSTTTNVPRTGTESHYLQASASHRQTSPHLEQHIDLASVSPEAIDPAVIDRTNLVGVGELSTPRWAVSNDLSLTPPLPNRNWAQAQGETGLGLGMGVHNDQSLLSLNTLTDFDFDSTMTAALAASLSVPDETASPLLSPALSSPPQIAYPDVSPGSARSRIYARRMSRQAAMATEPPPRTSSKQSPPPSADPYRNRRTPPQSAPKSKASPSSSHHDILKHFAPKDFSHLPPSPSTASINQFLRGSTSNNNITTIETPPSAGTTSYFGVSPAGPPVDAETAEALRKLDGLGSTPGKKASRTKASTSMSSIHSRHGTPPPGKGRLSASSHEKLSSPLNNWVDLTDELPTVPGTRQASSKREPSAVVSRDSSTTSIYPSISKDRLDRRSSASSDASNDISNPKPDVPPVPPLPSNYSRQAVALDSPEFNSPMSDSSRPRQMSKKWSFSSALNLRLHKESSPASPGIDATKSPQLGVSQPPSDDGSRSSTTPVGSSTQGLKNGSAKRSTPSSIPFFRRASSQSIESMPPPASKTRNAPPTAVRKSVLGMSIPSMLRTNSKRAISDQVETGPVTETPPQSASTGWTGRKRGKASAEQIPYLTADFIHLRQPRQAHCSTDSNATNTCLQQFTIYSSIDW